jgi:hypothetical protein
LFYREIRRFWQSFLEFFKLLGFATGWGLCKATYSSVFREIDAADFEARVGT